MNESSLAPGGGFAPSARPPERLFAPPSAPAAHACVYTHALYKLELTKNIPCSERVEQSKVGQSPTHRDRDFENDFLADFEETSRPDSQFRLMVKICQIAKRSYYAFD